MKLLAQISDPFPKSHSEEWPFSIICSSLVPVIWKIVTISIQIVNTKDIITAYGLCTAIHFWIKINSSFLISWITTTNIVLLLTYPKNKKLNRNKIFKLTTILHTKKRWGNSATFVRNGFKMTIAFALITVGMPCNSIRNLQLWRKINST